ncbi:major capsid protein [Rhodobacter phage RcZahn]|nr:major capsid protein [Rhodobacter phage RcZahn]
MPSNQSLLQKADLAIADLTANGGELLPEQGASFIRKLILQPTIMKQCRTVEMTTPKRKINKIGFGSRILRKATSGVALTQNQRSKPTTEQIELDTKEQIAEVRLPYDVLEDNIERATAANNEASNTGPDRLRQTLIDLIAERAALDLEELGLLADTTYTSGDADDQAYLSQLNGWLKRAETNGNEVDAGNATISRQVFKAGMKIMPKQYLRNVAQMKHFVSVNNEIEYRDTLANRTGQLGDGMTTGQLEAFAYGSPVAPVQLMPEAEGLYTHPMNLIFGIQRQVSMEFDKDITARVYIIVLTTRIDFQIEETEAVVHYSNIAS